MISKITKLCLLALLPAALVLPQPVFAEVTITDLGTLGGSYSEARGINGLGQVAGYSYTAWGNYHAFLWTAAGGIVDLGTMGGSHSVAWSINDLGQMVGYSYTTPWGNYHAALWTLQAPPSGTIESITDDVNALVIAGALNEGQGNSLLQKLAAAAQQMDKGNTSAAINVLQAFINQVNSFIGSGVLASAQGQPLIDAANALIVQLSG